MAAPDYKKLLKNCQEYDYIRFTFADINGTARGKTVPSKAVAKSIEDGIQIYAGTMAMGHAHEIPFKLLEADVGSQGQNNCNLIPDPGTLHTVSWSEKNDKNDRKHMVAEIYCEPHWVNSNLPQPAPRHIARLMLQKLDEMGWEILAGTELEFKIFKDTNTTNRVPLFPGLEFCSVLRFSLLEDLIFYLENNMAAVGVNTESLMCEYSPGQFEFALEPSKGIKASDNAFLFKQGIMEMVLKKGFGISFMAKADSIPGGGNGAHFNHSIWEKSTGKNVFYDSNASDHLSPTAKHWIAGLVKHAPALTALCSPTVNCYRRVHQPWAPDLCNWNISDRNAFLRVKNEGENGTYMENRMPSSAANPYIVMAATIAAGMDGVIRKMSPPSPQDTSAPKLPSTLLEAIEALEADTDLAEILGTDFVRYFVGIKKEIDLEKYKDHDVTKFIEGQFIAEIEGYEMKP